MLAEWLANGRRKAIATGPDMTMVELIAACLRHARAYYRGPDGEPTSQLHIIEGALAPVRRLYGRTIAAEFGPLALKAVRQHLIEQGLARRRHCVMPRGWVSDLALDAPMKPGLWRGG